MADNELMKDAELDEVVGGSGIECMGLMARLQDAGLAKFSTPLVAGNEEAAAAEFKAYLTGLKNSDGTPVLKNPQVYSDGRANDYFHDMIIATTDPNKTDTDILIDLIKQGGWH